MAEIARRSERVPWPQIEAPPFLDGAVVFTGEDGQRVACEGVALVEVVAEQYVRPLRIERAELNAPNPRTRSLWTREIRKLGPGSLLLGDGCGRELPRRGGCGSQPRINAPRNLAGPVELTGPDGQKVVCDGELLLELVATEYVLAQRIEQAQANAANADTESAWLLDLARMHPRSLLLGSGLYD